MDPEKDTATKTVRDDNHRSTPSQSVIQAVTAETGTDPREMQPLGDVIDTDALDRLFGSKSGSPGRTTEGCFSFLYEGCRVTVYADGRTVAVPEGRPRL
jgi:hypothetical protein